MGAGLRAFSTRFAAAFMVAAVVAVGALAGCHDSAAPARPVANGVERTITQASLDSLAVIHATDGRLLCLSDGRSACPFNAVTANWMHDGRFATWEPNRLVQIWTPGDKDPRPLGEVGTNLHQYGNVLSVMAAKDGYTLIDGQGPRVLHYDAKGVYQSGMPIPPLSVVHAVGFSSDVAILQLIRSVQPGGPATFEIRQINTPADTTGPSVLKVPLPWLHIRDDHPSAAVPLFPVLPSFAFAADSDIVWSPGDTFVVHRQSLSGQSRWTLRSTVTGPPIAAGELAAMRLNIQQRGDTASLTRFDSSAAHTGAHRGALAGILVARSGRVLAVSLPVTTRDSVDYFVINDDGKLAGRFLLPRTTHVLLFAGDSLLAQRPGANAQLELRWLMVK